MVIAYVIGALIIVANLLLVIASKTINPGSRVAITIIDAYLLALLMYGAMHH